MSWWRFPCRRSQVCLDITLSCGQSFRWRRDAVTGEWRGSLFGHVWRLVQNGDGILFRVHSQNDNQLSEDVAQQYLFDYFNTDVDLESLYAEWKKADSHFALKSERLEGVRMLRQDPLETLFSFICSSNNNIERISGMVEKLCVKYGDFILEFEGTKYYTFPSPTVLARERVESDLRTLGFGYRAKYIHQTAKLLTSKPEGWLDGLRKMSYSEAHAELMSLPGVGAKVADCVCLMSLDKMEAIPVDTHVWQIANRDYKLKLTSKSLTTRVYNEIGDHFRMLFGRYAGWAHSVLFSADLKRFRSIDGPANKAKSGISEMDSSASNRDNRHGSVKTSSSASKKKQTV